ncbi:hypothetical protein BC477_18125 [Clavibacter michiganensis subsp. michiganensis]|uniref:Uncharacterized protein n=1 Tax=Clavibacter michiganensis subsp. michiganensis TaxID=33013 RepID=A0A251XFS0_CLAMM|nr:hypothetical protein BC477_18125 [Clavibacter michiganensis subsp. michiganensis]OUE01399.1 hypothetical protein CMMCAS07_13910 [Clavibacter michiganensis subsp. michiganensis]
MDRRSAGRTVTGARDSMVPDPSRCNEMACSTSSPTLTSAKRGRSSVRSKCQGTRYAGSGSGRMGRGGTGRSMRAR